METQIVSHLHFDNFKPCDSAVITSASPDLSSVGHQWQNVPPPFFSLLRLPFFLLPASELRKPRTDSSALSSSSPAQSRLVPHLRPPEGHPASALVKPELEALIGFLIRRFGEAGRRRKRIRSKKKKTKRLIFQSDSSFFSLKFD